MMTEQERNTARDVLGCDEVLIHAIAKDVAREAGVSLSDLLGRSRARHLTAPRQLVMFLARERGLSFPTIGRAMNRDHTSVLNGVRATQRRIDEAKEKETNQ